MNELDIDKLRDDFPPEGNELEYAAVRARARKLRARSLSMRGSVAAVVALAVVTTAIVAGSRHAGDSLRTVVSGDPSTVALPSDPATKLCFPDPFPSKAAPATDRDVAVAGWPEGLPALLVLEGNGDLWVIDEGRARAWSTGTYVGDAASGYVWARFATDGTIYASRLVDAPEIALDHLDAPTHLAETIALPFTVNPDAPAGSCPIDGYLATFAIGPEGLVLTRHETQTQECPRGLIQRGIATTTSMRCLSPEALTFETRDGNFHAEGDDLNMNIGGSGTIVGDAVGSPTFAVVDGELLLLMTPPPAPSGVTPTVDGIRSGSVFALAPDASRLAFSPDGRQLKSRGTSSIKADGTPIWTSPDTIDGLAWTGTWIVVSHGGRLTLVSSVDGTSHELTGFEPGPVLSLDWAR